MAGPLKARGDSSRVAAKQPAGMSRHVHTRAGSSHKCSHTCARTVGAALRLALHGSVLGKQVLGAVACDVPPLLHRFAATVQLFGHPLRVICHTFEMEGAGAAGAACRAGNRQGFGGAAGTPPALPKASRSCCPPRRQLNSSPSMYCSSLATSWLHSPHRLEAGAPPLGRPPCRQRPEETASEAAVTALAHSTAEMQALREPLRPKRRTVEVQSERVNCDIAAQHRRDAGADCAQCSMPDYSAAKAVRFSCCGGVVAAAWFLENGSLGGLPCLDYTNQHYQKPYAQPASSWATRRSRLQPIAPFRPSRRSSFLG